MTTIPSSPPALLHPRQAGSAGCCLAFVLLLAACTPDPPDKEVPPEPQAAQHTELRDAIHEPIDRARQVEADTLEAAAAQREAIDAATGG